MKQEEVDAIVSKVNTDLGEVFKKEHTKVEQMVKDMEAKTQEKINTAVEAGRKGLLSPEKAEEIVKEQMKEYSTKTSSLEEALREQGEVLAGLKEKIKAVPEKGESLEDLIKKEIPKLKELFKAGTGFIKIEAKAAGVTSIGNAVQAMAAPPGSPYAPGIGGPALTLYDILRNPNFVSNYVNVGRTSESRIAWINETSLMGYPALVPEGSQKPLTQRTFQVEYSLAKKVAAYIQVTEEFDRDLPGLATAVQRLLQNDVVRAYDDQVQTDVIANVSPFSFSPANVPGNPTIGASMAAFQKNIFDATYWDALLIMATQVRLSNFIPNISLLNPGLWAKLMTSKDTLGRYNYPPDDIIKALNIVQGNKLYPDYALAGDLQQFNVDIYEDFVIKMGWINDDFIRNQFTIVAEVRFHDYISTARKPAIVYGNAKYIAEQLYSSSAPIVGS